MVATTMGRVMNTLLETRTKKLTDSISRLDYSPKIITQAGNFSHFQSLFTVIPVKIYAQLHKVKRN